jgi:hypothetical protein
MRVVTAYYKIPSKLDHRDYISYIRNFFTNIKVPVLFFTGEEELKELEQYARSNVTFCVRPIMDLEVFNHYDQEFWGEQVELTSVKGYRVSWILGALWANKLFFIKDAFTKYPQEDWICWVDAGCMRSDDWGELTVEFGSRNIPTIPGVYIQQLEELHNKVFYEGHEICIAAGSILAHKQSVNTVIESYLKVLDLYKENNKCAIDDQYIYASILGLNISSDLKPINIHSINLSSGARDFPKDWFFFLSYV